MSHLALELPALDEGIDELQELALVGGLQLLERLRDEGMAAFLP